ncbi:hypothetical protein G6F46_012916 [Rhizopus delemar]|uniref:Uncharacterized protein n=2 Tax=Rhizopus TaxID=4842 RepID=A0A9P6YHX2_9FUNG|nr:hypothetical protein G6F36_011744 [Rhizopus arrhizus]KAG1442959.1 hypothetical protein G6F55_012812 [Rhizopus delemar]KAG1487700.1 hypothetical protein G6F54_012501 [Rhizopus delemar]KAG1493494.1 hypothetical protein G6F53_012743 [Rhizopus delemar]KAG1500278.1 hypothetical protein G6F52_012575 [Rhizopus delemar]
MTNELNNSTTPPAWANALLQRLEHLESRISSSNLLSEDPNVIVRALGSDFTPTVDMLEQHPYISEDFFRRPLDENQRRRYLFEYPKNTLRQ